MSFSDRHYGAGDPNCPVCGGLGYIRYDVPEEHPLFGKALECICRKQAVDAERQRYLRRIGGLEHLSDKTFESFEVDNPTLTPLHQDNLRRAWVRAQAYAQHPEGWLIFTGGYGCGKTHLAAAIANAHIAAGNKVFFITVPDLLDYLRASYGPEVTREAGYAARFEEIRNAPLLILDDLGMESHTPWAAEKLYQILNHRTVRRLPTVITTNYNLSDFSVRLRSRLTDPDIVEVVAIIAPDHRRSALNDPTDLYSLGLLRHLTFETFQKRHGLTPEQRQNLDRAVQLAKRFAEQPKGWLVFFGTHGCGKSHLAAAIANYQLTKGGTALFVTVPDLLDHLRAAFAPNSPVTYDRRFQEVRNTPLLILDDLGTESATAWAREKLNQILIHRYDRQLPTVMTTSYEIEQLERSDPRLVTRLRDKRICTLFVIEAPAYIIGQTGQKAAHSRW